MYYVCTVKVRRGENTNGMEWNRKGVVKGWYGCRSSDKISVVRALERTFLRFRITHLQCYKSIGSYLGMVASLFNF